MNRLKHILTLTLLVLLATACSKDDDLTQGSNIPTDDAGQQTVTFTVGADYTLEGDARTRSEGTEEEKPTRCFLQVLDAGGTNLIASASDDTPDDKGSFQLSVSGLTTGTTYQFLFWADNASTTISDLKAVPYTPNTVAYAEKKTGTPEEVSRNITLPHVVTKVTLVTTTNVPTTYSKTISLAASCASSYNVQTPTSSTFTEVSKSIEMGDNGLTANSEVLTTYIIPNPNEQAVTINAHTMDMTLDDVQLEANTHVTLQGDLSTDNSKWKNAPAALVEETFMSYFFNGDGDNNPKGQLDTGNDYYFSGTADDLQNLIRYITRNPDFTLSDSSQFIIGSGFGDNFYVYASRMFDGTGLIYYHNGSTIYTFYIRNGNYPTVPTPPTE